MGKKLQLVTEKSLKTLLEKNKDLEASGVVVKGNRIFVNFDNTPSIAEIELTDNDHFRKVHYHHNSKKHNPDGFEGIACDPHTKHLFVNVEAVKGDNGKCYSYLYQLNDHYQPVHKQKLHGKSFEEEHCNKGFEGIAIIRKKNHPVLLALCEGNHCTGGTRGEEAGNGRVVVFTRQDGGWHHHETIHLPSGVDFKDYSDLAVRATKDPTIWKIAVTSQEKKRLWIGKLDVSSFTIQGNGQQYRFPHGQKHCKYCNVEGVDWNGKKKIILVSDRTKKDDQPTYCKRKEMSIHLMRIP